MSIFPRVLKLVTCWAIGLGAAGVSGPVLGSDWEWMLTPYLWASDTSADLTLDGKTIEGEIEFEDLIEKVDLAMQVHFEGKRDRLGFFVDLTYLKVEESESVEPTLPFDDKLRVETAIETMLLEAAGTYRVLGESKLAGLELFLGARVIEMDLELDLAFPGPLGESLSVSSDETLVDAFIGARFAASFSSHWTIALRGDIATGDTDFTWNAEALLMYRFGKNDRFGAVGGYRYLVMEYETSGGGHNIDAEFTMSGPMLGFAFRF